MFKHIFSSWCYTCITGIKTKNSQTMKKLQLVAVAILISVSAFAQTWSVDKAHSKLGFGITHMMITEVDGTFKSFDAKITSSKEDFSDAVFELTVDAASVDTNNEGRDKHLKSADFFDVEKFPTITFKSKSFTKVEGKKYKLVGDLTMHGVTKQVELEATLTGTATGRNNTPLAGFKVTGTLKRSDFGVGGQSPAVGDEVTIEAKGEFAKK